MMTALLVDDEPMANERMAELLASFPDVEIIGTADTVADAEQFLAHRMPDVIFLDIRMPGRPGFELAEKVPASSRIVFVTAHADRVLDAFRVDAIDYLLKPVDRDRLAVTIDRLQRRLATSSPSAAELLGGSSTRFHKTAVEESAVLELADHQSGTVLIKLAGSAGIEKLLFADIAWVESHRNYTFVHTLIPRRLLVRGTMSQWQSILPATAFGRISRSLIVNVAAIRSLQWQSRDQTVIFFRGTDASLPIGRLATARLKRRLGP